MNQAKAEFIKALKSIGWDAHLTHDGLNDWIINHNGNRTPWRLMNDHLEPWNDSQPGGGDPHCVCVHFSFKDLRIMDHGTICLGSKSSFVLFMNHDK